MTTNPMKRIALGKLTLAALAMLICFPQALRACEPDGGTTPAKPLEAKEALRKEFNKTESFLIGMAKSDFVEEQRNADDEKLGLIDKVALHGLSWFPQEGGDGDVYFVGHVSLDTPITAAQHKAIQAAIEKHRVGKVFLKFSARLTKEGTTEFQGNLLGYYVVMDEEHEGFVEKLVKDREWPGFVTLIEQGGTDQPAANPPDHRKVVEKMTALGILRHFPSDVKSVQAWYGHNFLVGDTPVIATDKVSEETLKGLIGELVAVTGTWNPGERWKPTEEEFPVPTPQSILRDAEGVVDAKGVVRGDGIEATTIKRAKK